MVPDYRDMSDVQKTTAQLYVLAAQWRARRKQFINKKARFSSEPCATAMITPRDNQNWPSPRPKFPECDPEFWLNDVEGPAALSLVYAWIMANPEWLARYIAPYTTFRYDRARNLFIENTIVGHFRRRANMGTTPSNLARTCKFDRSWVRNSLVTAPYQAERRRRDEDGLLIPRECRVLLWH